MSLRVLVKLMNALMANLMVWSSVMCNVKDIMHLMKIGVLNVEVILKA